MPTSSAPAAESPTARNERLLLLAVFLTGFAALAYEIAWTRLLALPLGSESLAVLGVLGGFFLGMALGSACVNALCRRGVAAWRLFVLVELVGIRKPVHPAGGDELKQFIK